MKKHKSKSLSLENGSMISLSKNTLSSDHLRNTRAQIKNFSKEKITTWKYICSYQKNLSMEESHEQYTHIDVYR